MAEHGVWPHIRLALWKLFHNANLIWGRSNEQKYHPYPPRRSRGGYGNYISASLTCSQSPRPAGECALGQVLTSRNITHITRVAAEGDIEVIFLRVWPAVTAHDPKGSVLWLLVKRAEILVIFLRVWPTVTAHDPQGSVLWAIPHAMP